MNHCRKRSLALAAVVALALCASGALAAAPPHAIPDSYLNYASVPSPGRLNIWAPVATATLGGDEARLAIATSRANIVTSCTPATFAAPPITTMESCLDDGSVPRRELTNALLLAPAGAPYGDSTGSASLPIWTSAVVLSAPAAAATSSAIPDPRPDNPPIPPPDWRNIWAPVSAVASGGSGTWSLTSASWTDIYGDAPATMSPRPGFAVFQGTPGTVTVDNSAGAVGFIGMHFAVDGYTLTGDALQLAGSAGSLANIGVGDGTSASAVDRAVINNALTGSAGLNKVDFGWLVLAGNNTYSGGTTISSGILQIGSSTSGSIIGDLIDNASLWFSRSDSMSYGGVISGTGSLTQNGAGMLTLTGANTYTGTTTIEGGKLALAGSGSIANSNEVDLLFGTFDISGTSNGATVKSLTGSGAVVLGANTLTVVDALPGAYIFGTVSGSGGLTLLGGELDLESPNTYTGLTTIAPGAKLKLGYEPDDVNGSVAGDILDNGVLEFAGFSGTTYGRTIPGTGSVIADMVNGLTLTADNTYSGGTTISAGTLQLGNGGTSGSIIGDVTDNGSLIFNHRDAVTFGGVISGTGSLTQAGTGTLKLTGTNTYSGGTNINAGVLQVSSDANLGAANGIVQFGNGTLQVAGSFTLSQGISVGNTASFDTNGHDLTLAGTVDLASCICYVSLVKDGAGTLTLAGTTNSAGLPAAVDVNAGTLALSGDGFLNPASLNIANGAVFDISQAIGEPAASISSLSGSGTVALGGNNLTVGTYGSGWTFGGVISDGGINGGSGGGVIMGGGLGTLTGQNTYTGETSIQDGILALAGNGSISDSSLVFIATTYGTLDISGTTIGATVKGLAGGGSVVLGGQTLTVSDADAANVFGGVISGTGGLVLSGGTLILSGLNTYSGGTTIEGTGKLQTAKGVQGPVTITSGGMLDAVPGVGSNLSNAGKVAVHGGDTTVGGTYTQASAGTLAVSLGSKLAINGTATINSGTLEVTGADPGYVANTHTEVLTATGGVTGTFGQLVKDTGVVFTSTTIGYGPNDVYLDTTGLNITVAAAAMGIADAPSMAAAQRVQTGFESINATMASGGKPASDVLEGAGAIQHSATPAVAQATLTSLSGQLHAASAAMLFDGIDAGSNALSEHFDDLAGGRANSGAWYGDLGWQGNLQRGGYAGATFRSDGGMAGADMRIGTHGVFGFAVGQSRGFGQLDAGWDHGRTWMNSLAMYGGVVNGPWYASAQIAGGWYREDMQRLLLLGALGSRVGAGSTGSYAGGALEGGRLLNLGAIHVVPFADVRYQRLDLGGFTEQGGLGYGLTANARTAGRLQTGLGVRAGRGWRLANGMRVEFDGSAGWQHTLHQYGSVFDASFTGFNDWMPVEGIGLSRDTVILRTGLSLWPTRDFGLRLGYMREQDQRERAGSAMLQGTVTF